ncbi:hypothetical protein A2U01_0078556, partial [Trifolium medium]|nr:hypothetical protein [Trifolium medium]
MPFCSPPSVDCASFPRSWLSS